MSSQAEGPIGFIGVGVMGSGIVSSLLKADFTVRVYDRDAAKLDAAVAAGAQRGAGARQLIAECPVVACSLPNSHVFQQVADEVLIPHARTDQVFLDFGTTTVPQTQRIAGLLRAKGAWLLDAPVSGNPLVPGFRVFVGGEVAVSDRCRPIFAALTEMQFATYCGSSGAGQIVKGVNQLGMALISAACMEAVAFGVASGIDAGILGAAVGGENGFRREIADVAAQVVRGRATSYDAKYAELPYFLEQARVAGFKIPLTDALHAFCESGPSQWRDTMNRPYVSFWHQLMQAVQPQMET